MTERCKTVRAMRASFLARSVSGTDTLKGLLAMLPRATALDLLQTWFNERRG